MRGPYLVVQSAAHAFTKGHYWLNTPQGDLIISHILYILYLRLSFQFWHQLIYKSNLVQHKTPSVVLDFRFLNLQFQLKVPRRQYGFSIMSQTIIIILGASILVLLVLVTIKYNQKLFSLLMGCDSQIGLSIQRSAIGQ